jgi:hypothetical protein
MKISPLFLLSFLKRYWPLLLLFVSLVLLGKIDQVVYFVGPLFYLIQLVVGVMVAVLLGIHVVFRQTIDPMLEPDPASETGESFFGRTWATLTSRDKIWLAFITICVLTLSFSIIAASIAK